MGRWTVAVSSMDDVGCENADLINENISGCERSSQSLGEEFGQGRYLWPIVGCGRACARRSERARLRRLLFGQAIHSNHIRNLEAATS